MKEGLMMILDKFIEEKFRESYFGSHMWLKRSLEERFGVGGFMQMLREAFRSQ